MSLPKSHCGIPVKGGNPPPPQASSSSSSLEPLQTKPPAPVSPHIDRQRWGNPEFLVEPVTPAEASFRHSGWAVKRRQTFESFTRLHLSEPRIDRFCNCGSGLYMQANAAADDVRIVCNTCGDRWCVPCATVRAARIRDTIAGLLAGKFTRFITLTLRHSNTPLADQIDRVWRSFTALRRRSFWRSAVTGGAAVLEIKLSGIDGLWHPHIHIVCEGKFMNQRELSRQWHGVTGDSSIVHIKAVGDPAAQASYLTKYITKPADASVYACPERLDEMVSALKGRRLCATFGSWRGIELEAHAPPDPGWKTVARLDSLASQSRDGDADAQRWLDVARRRWPELAAVFGWPANSS